MKEKDIFHEFDPIIYPYVFWVAIGGNNDQLKDRFILQNNSDITTEGIGTCKAYTLAVRDTKTGKKGSLIMFRSKKDMTCNTMAHESSHAVKELFTYIGADMRPDEPFEYLLGWLVEKCEEIKKLKI